MTTTTDRMAEIVKGAVAPPAAAQLVGFVLASFTPGEAVLHLEAGDCHTNPMGTVQGGVLAAMADAAMGWAFMTSLAEDETYTTLEMKINFLRPVWKGRLTATGRVRKGGKTVALIECDVVDDAGRSVAYATSTCMVLRGEQASGR
jgi:uncharacterized protein (TIGR00369 family)